MTTRLPILRVALVVLCASAAATVAAPAEAPNMVALTSLQPGQWTLKSRTGSSEAVRTLCLGDPRILLQVRHAGVACSRFVITNAPQQTVVHYTCPRSGHGHTTVRVETPRLIQIDSQGIIDNTPFELALEGRRVGECATAATKQFVGKALR